MNARRIRVVLADDTPEIRLLYRVGLEGDGRFEIAGEAADGREAVSIAAARRPDVILLDVAMPKMDGLQAVPRIRKVSARTKIVILSGLGLAELGGDALLEQVDAYLEKGQPLSSVMATLLSVCGQVEGVSGRAVPSPESAD